MRSFSLCLLLAAALPLLGCADVDQNTPAPDMTVKLAPRADGNGLVALPPECANWRTDTLSPFENQPIPQFGCATARNLAAMVEQPEDLAQGRPLGDTNGAVAANNMQLYIRGKTTELLDPNAKTSNQTQGTRNDLATK